MIINRREGLPGYGNIGNDGSIGKKGFSTYYYSSNLNTFDNVKYVYDRLINTSGINNIEDGKSVHIDYNPYDYIMDNRSYVYRVNDLIENGTNNIPSPLYSFVLSNYFAYYTGNRICSNEFVDNVVLNRYYIYGNAGDYINYIIDSSKNYETNPNKYPFNYNTVNHIIFNNNDIIDNDYAYIPYTVNIAGFYYNGAIDNSLTKYNYIANITDIKNKLNTFNIFGSNSNLIFNNFIIKYDKNRDMTFNTVLNKNGDDENTLFPIISLCDMNIKNLLPRYFKIVNNSIDIVNSNALTISMNDEKTMFIVNWNLNKIFNNVDYFENNINDYACDLLVYTNHKEFINNDASIDISTGKIDIGNNSFTYTSNLIPLKIYDSSNNTGELSLMFNQSDASVEGGSLNYRFALRIKSRNVLSEGQDFPSGKNFKEYCVYTNAITQSASGIKYYLNVDKNNFNIGYDASTFTIDVETNIISYNSDIPFIINNNNTDWITTSVNIISNTLYRITFNIKSNKIDNNNTDDRSSIITIIGREDLFNQFSQTITIAQKGFIDSKPQVELLDIRSPRYRDLDKINSYDNGIYSDMIQMICDVPIINANNSEWKNAGAKYIELELDINISFKKVNDKHPSNYKLFDIKENSFKIGVQYIGKDYDWLNNIDTQHYDYITSKAANGINNVGKVQDLFNEQGVKMYINEKDKKYLNTINPYNSNNNFKYIGAAGQYNKLKWIDFANDRNYGTSINTDYFDEVEPYIYECNLRSDDPSTVYPLSQKVLNRRIIIPIEDGLTDEEYNTIVYTQDGYDVDESGQVVIRPVNYYIYDKICPKIRIFLEEENACVSELSTSIRKKGIKLLDSNFNELNNASSKKEYINATSYNFSKIKIIDWKLTNLTRQLLIFPTNNIEANYNSSFMKYGYMPYTSQESLEEELKWIKILIRAKRPTAAELATDYKQYAYAYSNGTNSLPSVIGETSFLKYGFGSTLSTEYGIINGQNVLVSKYKQRTYNYPIYGTQRELFKSLSDYVPNNNFNTIWISTVVPSGMNNKYIPDSLARTWYGELRFGSWSVPEITSTSNVIQNHEMTTKRNLDEVRLGNSEYLPETVNGLLEGINPTYATASNITKYACPFNIFFNVDRNTDSNDYLLSNDEYPGNVPNRTYRYRTFTNSADPGYTYYYMFRRPMIQTWDLTVDPNTMYQVFFKSDSDSTYFNSMPTIGCLTQQYNIPS